MEENCGFAILVGGTFANSNKPGDIIIYQNNKAIIDHIVELDSYNGFGEKEYLIYIREFIH